MYVPAHFLPPDDEAVARLLAERGAADLITVTSNGLVATLLPLIYAPADGGGPDRLLGHVARNNDQWRLPAMGEALAIVRGPDAYITPAWYATKAEHGRVVPTWNYLTAHVYGELVIHDDPVWVEQIVRMLTEKQEHDRRPEPWSVDDAPRKYIEGQLRAIVGVELVISRIEAKFKLGQNRSADDVRGVVAGLEAQRQTALAAQTRQASERKLSSS